MRRMAIRSGVWRLGWRGLIRGKVGRAVRHMETGTRWTGAAVQPSETEVLLGGMTKHACGFPVQGDSVEILETPSQFYNVLLQGVRNALSRVVIASLYIGTGTLEQELVGSSPPPVACSFQMDRLLLASRPIPSQFIMKVKPA